MDTRDELSEQVSTTSKRLQHAQSAVQEAMEMFLMPETWQKIQKQRLLLIKSKLKQMQLLILPLSLVENLEQVKHHLKIQVQLLM